MAAIQNLSTAQRLRGSAVPRALERLYKHDYDKLWALAPDTYFHTRALAHAQNWPQLKTAFEIYHSDGVSPKHPAKALALAQLQSRTIPGMHPYMCGLAIVKDKPAPAEISEDAFREYLAANSLHLGWADNHAVPRVPHAVGVVARHGICWAPADVGIAVAWYAVMGDFNVFELLLPGNLDPGFPLMASDCRRTADAAWYTIERLRPHLSLTNGAHVYAAFQVPLDSVDDVGLVIARAFAETSTLSATRTVKAYEFLRSANWYNRAWNVPKIFDNINDIYKHCAIDLDLDALEACTGMHDYRPVGQLVIGMPKRTNELGKRIAVLRQTPTVLLPYHIVPAIWYLPYSDAVGLVCQMQGHPNMLRKLLSVRPKPTPLDMDEKNMHAILYYVRVKMNKK